MVYGNIVRVSWHWHFTLSCKLDGGTEWYSLSLQLPLTPLCEDSHTTRKLMREDRRNNTVHLAIQPKHRHRMIPFWIKSCTTIILHCPPLAMNSHPIGSNCCQTTLFTQTCLSGFTCASAWISVSSTTVQSVTSLTRSESNCGWASTNHPDVSVRVYTCIHVNQYHLSCSSIHH